jgi:hypothetical protein
MQHQRSLKQLRQFPWGWALLLAWCLGGIEEWLPAVALGGEWQDRVAGPVIGCALLRRSPQPSRLRPLLDAWELHVRIITLYQKGGKTGLLNYCETNPGIGRLQPYQKLSFFAR